MQRTNETDHKNRRRGLQCAEAAVGAGARATMIDVVI